VKEPFLISQVVGIGAPYNLSCVEENDLPTEIESPVAVRFVTIQGKHCGEEIQTGRFTAIAENGAILQTQYPLSPYENIRIDAGGELFAKVIRHTDSGLLLRFTSVPADYPSWISEQLKK